MHYHRDKPSWSRIEQRFISQVFGEMRKRYTQLLGRNETVHNVSSFISIVQII